MRDVATIVLSGGRSRRMGAAKALLDYGSTSFLEHQVNLYAALGEVLVTVNPELEENVSRLDLKARFVVNPRPEDGLFSSVRLGLLALAGHMGPVFVTPVDSMLPDARVPRALLASRRGGGDVLVPVCRGRRGHPVLLLPSALQPLREAAATGIFSRELGKLNLVEVPVDEEWILLNVNTPADYTCFLEMAAQRRREP